MLPFLPFPLEIIYQMSYLPTLALSEYSCWKPLRYGALARYAFQFSCPVSLASSQVSSEA